MGLSVNNMNLLQKGLDVAWKRNEVIGDNIANADTPNFKASRVEFEDILKSELNDTGGTAMKTTNPKHMNAGGSAINSIQPVIRQDDSVSMRLDGNNVDVENEMTELAKNNLLYQTLIQKMTSQFSRIRFAINGGK